MLSTDGDPSHASLSDLVSEQAPIFLPWCKANIYLGDGFDSRLAIANKLPWTGRSAFDQVHSAAFTAEVDSYAATIRESTSTASKASSEHMSASLGVTVGCDFLSANVTGSYDETTTSNATVGTMHSRT